MDKQRPALMVFNQINSVKNTAVNPVKVTGANLPCDYVIVVQGIRHANFFIVTTKNDRDRTIPGMIM